MPKRNRPIIIDCGSNIGLSVLFFKRQYPDSHVIAFEADPELFKIQKENLKAFEDLDLYNQAVWVDDSGVKLSRDFNDGAFVSGHGDTQVNSVRLKSILEEQDQVDLLKMDIEGAEFDLLEDCADQLYKVDKLFVEIHTFSSQDQQIANILNIIERAGFRYFIENVNQQNQPLFSDWHVGKTGMDLQLNLYATRK